MKNRCDKIALLKGKTYNILGKTGKE